MDSDDGRVGSVAEEMKRQMTLQMQRFRVTQIAGRAAAEHTKEYLKLHEKVASIARCSC